MSLAWATIVVLILLLPGIFFLMVVYSLAGYPRDTRARNPVYPLAGIISVAFVIHGGYYAFVDPLFCGNIIPCAKAVYLSSALHSSSISADSTVSLAQSLYFRKYIFFYIVATCVVGYVLGKTLSYIIMKGFFRASSEHPWIRDIVVDGGVVLAHVLTNIREDDRILMYKGLVKEIYATAEGQLSYLMISNAERYYMILDEDYPKIEMVSMNSRHGETSLKKARIHPAGSGSNIEWNKLLIGGDEIANVVFQRLWIPPPRLGLGVEDFNDVIDRVRKRIRNKKIANIKEQNS